LEDDEAGSGSGRDRRGREEKQTLISAGGGGSILRSVKASFRRDLATIHKRHYDHAVRVIEQPTV
jgi:hypothetical protein